MIESQPMPESMKEAAKNYLLELPYMEGVWVNKHAGKYYLQYATPSSGHNIYNDAVYISDAPLGPYVLAQNNPYSYKPGGFLPGAGHGSTMEDEAGRIWHTSTMRICKNHNFERRIGLWSAGYDADGELFCNQRYGDWPQDMDALKADPGQHPKWMLLSFGAGASASSIAEKKSNRILRHREWERRLRSSQIMLRQMPRMKMSKPGGKPHQGMKILAADRSGKGL